MNYERSLLIGRNYPKGKLRTIAEFFARRSRYSLFSLGLLYAQVTLSPRSW